MKVESSPAWGRTGVGVSKPLSPLNPSAAAARAAELAGMDDQELEKHHRRLIERANLLGLEVHAGGKLTARRTG